MSKIIPAHEHVMYFSEQQWLGVAMVHVTCAREVMTLAEQVLAFDSD